ncbi:hypothetical protein Aph01nite_79010 [Acrocarpospora phusangensis]|uniref:Type I-E CRISPR-associated protein Cse2/CasB n=1 Tax=Acrocarpospora phusangensis TaxID=1070424 RepID=A0A919QIQ5_9ACTN|nr:type I-E CRISPR-associated protein Cse2/CasB [Acrocarpospora phusangensis]GIH29591.1 hypothetical protein Aph01nite_79010 [Acrocarpospora phusangensis]
MISIETADKYVAHVRKQVREDPGRRSALRRSLGRPVEDDLTRKAHSTVARWLPSDRTGAAVERAYYSVAALIAAQPRDHADQDGSDPESDTTVPISDETRTADGSDAGTRPEEPVERRTTSLGGTLGQAVTAGKLSVDTVEARLHLLCRQNVPGLHRHLPGLVRRLATVEIEPDWGRLLQDLSRWERARAQVGKRWLQDFYRGIHAGRDDNSRNEDDNPEGEHQ